MEASARPDINFDLMSHQYRGIIDLEPTAFRLLCAKEDIDPSAGYFKAAYLLLEKFCGTLETVEFFKQCGERGIFV
jgi:hypothetical protein